MSMTTREMREAHPPTSCALDTKRSCIGIACPKWVELTDNEGLVLCVESRLSNGAVHVLSKDFRLECRKEHEVETCWQCPDAFGHCS